MGSSIAQVYRRSRVCETVSHETHSKAKLVLYLCLVITPLES